MFVFIAWNTVSRELENFSQNGADSSKGKYVYILCYAFSKQLLFSDTCYKNYVQ